MAGTVNHLQPPPYAGLSTTLSVRMHKSARAIFWTFLHSSIILDRHLPESEYVSGAQESIPSNRFQVIDSARQHRMSEKVP
jgi:hypothetical protein